MSARRVTVIAAVVATVAIAAAAALAYFSSTKTTPQPISVAPYSSLPAETSLIPSWSIDDESGGGATSIYAPAFTDALFLKTANIGVSYPSYAYMDVDFAGYAPPGQTPDKVVAGVDFADDNGDNKTVCMYMELRRASTGAVLDTFGSAGSPLACQPLVTPLTVSQTLPTVTSTDVANDLRLRIYFNNEGGGAARLYRAVVNVSVLGRTWTLLPTSTTDALTGTPAAPVPWPLAKVDTTAYTNAANWGNSYSATKYLSLDYPDTVPDGARITDAKLESVWKTANGARHCFIVGVYAGGNLLATHGTTASPAMCTTSSTAWSTDTIALPEINTSARASAVTVRLYGWGGNKVNLDRVALKLTWDLGTFNCVDPHTETVPVTADSWADQNAPTSVNGGRDQDVHVRTQDGSRNRRGYLLFPLPSLPNACVLKSATLKMFQNAEQGGATRTIDVYRAASSWTESGLNWNNAPATTGTAAGTTNPANNNQTVTWDVTSLVRSMYSGQNYGFVVRDRVEDDSAKDEQKYDSRENGRGDPALLDLTYGEQP